MSALPRHNRGGHGVETPAAAATDAPASPLVGSSAGSAGKPANHDAVDSAESVRRRDQTAPAAGSRLTALRNPKTDPVAQLLPTRRNRAVTAVVPVGAKRASAAGPGTSRRMIRDHANEPGNRDER